MLNPRLFVLVFALSFADKAFAGKTQSYFFGGGGEESGKSETMFLDDLRDYYSVSKDKKWNTEFVHDGGHSIDESWLKVNSVGKMKSFTTAAYDKTLKELEQKISSGQLGPGDQLLIFFSTHGEKQGAGDKTHSIHAIDGKVNTNKLKIVRDLAEKKGLKLAIIDTSCYGGASIALGSEKTCVISMSDDSISYMGESKNLLREIAKAPNLEEAFLLSRLKENYAPFAQPQISTQAGKDAHEQIKFLNKDVLNAKKVIDGGKVDRDCKNRKENIADLKELLKKLNTSHNLVNSHESHQYTELLKSYRKDEAKLNQLADEVAAADAEKCLHMDYGGDFCLKFSDFAFSLKYHQDEVAANKDPYNISTQVVSGIQKTTLEDENYKAYAKKLKEAETMEDVVQEKTYEVTRMERELYNQIYRQNSAKSKKANPCADFKL